jgi:copper(I)-binding protein
MTAIVFAALLIAGHAEAQEFKAGGVTVVKPWARATPGGAKVGSAYLELKAAAGTEDRLVAANTPVAGTVEIHDHINEGGIMKMRRVDGINLSGGQTVKLKPGGYHLMLMDLKQPLKQGGKLPLTLAFEKAGEVAVEAIIAPVGAAGPSDRAASPPARASGGHKH